MNSLPMNLLILTQKIDIKDDVLGFFHAWIKKLAEKYSSILVICLQKGEYYLPENVRVLTLGKEKDRSRIKYISRFYRFIFRERGSYDAVFIHMNPVYAVLGGLAWRLWHKKIFLWFNHPMGSPTARMAVRMADAVFCTSPFAFANQYKKTCLMPAGIDTSVFQKDKKTEKTKGAILYIGRISKIKKIECLIESAKILDEKNMDFTLRIIGSPMLEEDIEYEKKLKTAARELIKKQKVKFSPKIVNSDAPAYFNKSDIVVNLTPTGSFDKTVLEAMACETLVLVSNKSFREILPEEFIFTEDNPKDLADKLCAALKLPGNRKKQHEKKFRKYAVENHSLDKLIGRINDFVF